MDNMNEYAARALRLANNLGPEGDLIHATLGITSEAGEIADAVKKHFAYGKPLNRDNVLEELGDLAWFMTLMMANLKTSWPEITAMNIAKLEKRYPDLKFNAEHATDRNKQLELEAMGNAANAR